MAEKSSSEVEDVSDYSESEKILDILSQKLPVVEETLTTSINVLQEMAEEEDERFNDRIDFIEAFKEIIEIYDLTKLLIESYYKKKALVHKIKNISYKYLDLKTNFKNLILDHKQKEDQCNHFEDLLRDVENENYELKIKIEDLQEIIKSLKESHKIKVSLILNRLKFLSSLSNQKGNKV